MYDDIQYVFRAGGMLHGTVPEMRVSSYIQLSYLPSCHVMTYCPQNWQELKALNWEGGPSTCKHHGTSAGV